MSKIIAYYVSIVMAISMLIIVLTGSTIVFGHVFMLLTWIFMSTYWYRQLDSVD